MHFFDKTIIITQIHAAVDVPQGTGRRIHRNRAYHGFAYFYGGCSMFHFQNGTSICVKSGDCIYLPKGSDYNVEHLPSDPTETPGCVAINFSINSPDTDLPFRIHIGNQQQFLTLFHNAIRLLKRKPAGYLEYCIADLYRILGILKETYSAKYTPGNKLQTIMPAIDYIAEHHTLETIPTATLAEKCNISESYFRKLFQRGFGISPVEYMRQMRLHYAKELLDSGEYSVSAASEISGFRDLSYFSREFKKVYGLSPAAYLKSNRT